MPRIKVALRWIVEETVELDVPDWYEIDDPIDRGHILSAALGASPDAHGTPDAAEVVEIDGQPAHVQLCEQQE